MCGCRDGSTWESELGEGRKQSSEKINREIYTTAGLTEALRGAERMTVVVVTVVNHDPALDNDFLQQIWSN